MSAPDLLMTRAEPWACATPDTAALVHGEHRTSSRIDEQALCNEAQTLGKP